MIDSKGNFVPAGSNGDVEKIPAIVRQRLNTAPLLPNESRKPLWDTFQAFERELRPETLHAYSMLAEVALLTFEVMRYRAMSAAIVTNQQRAGVEKLFLGISTYGVKSLGAPLQAANEASKFFTNDAYRTQSLAQFEREGFSPDVIWAEAFRLALPNVSAIDKLIASAWKRLDKFLKDLETRRNHRVAVLRLTAERLAAVSHDNR